MAFLEYRPTKTLFQYTSVDGFLAILRSRQLRLSDLRGANDPKEIDLGYDRVVLALKALAKAEQDVIALARFARLARHLTNYSGNMQAFCACFSLAADERPMWATYGDRYSGLAPGFRPSALDEINGRVSRVKYIDPTQTKDFERIAHSVAENVRNSALDDSLPRISACSDATAAAIAMKDQTWSYEKEVRLVYIQLRTKPQGLLANFPASQTARGEPIPWTQPATRLVGSRSVDYLQFPYGRFRDGRIDATGALKTVVIGPHCSLSVEAVEAELRAQGFRGCKVRLSDCSIRI